VTREAVALVRTAFGHYASGDFNALVALAHPDVEFDPVFISGNYRGVSQVRALLEGFEAPHRRWTASKLEYLGVAGRVVVTGRIHTQTAVGSPLDLPIAFLVEVHEDKITRVEGHMTLREAIQSAGTRSV
jgi:ketosteroid isomerase-like protein